MATTTTLEKQPEQEPVSPLDASLNEKEDVKGEPLHLEHIRGLPADPNARIHAVRNAAYEAAIKQGRLNPWSKDSWMLYFCCFISFLCSCANGYDSSLMTAINIMPYYQARFNGDVVGSGTSLIFSMYTIGQLVSPWIGGPLADRLGRRGGMFIGGIGIIVGMLVIVTAEAKPQFLAGRFLLGFFVVIMATAAPSYCVEVCPPHWRGRMTGAYNCGWFGGSIPAAGITLGTAPINSDLSWRLPLIFQAVPSMVVICAVWFLPESPRWLLANGHEQQALDFLIKYHGNGDPKNPIVELEWVEFKENIKLDASDKRWWDYSELFNTPSARWRSFMVILMGTFGQFSGNGLGYFNTQIYAAVGYDSYMQFVLNLANSFVSAFGAICGVSLADKMPRRPVLIWGTLICALMLGINGALSWKWAHNASLGITDLSVGKGAVAAYFFFGLIYGFTYSPLQALYPVECLQNTSRAKGMSMYFVVVGVMLFINLYCTPIALQNISYNYVFIFVGWDTIESVLWFFFCVETMGRTLEELEEIFSTPWPPRAGQRLHKIAEREDGAVTVIDDA